MKKTLTFLVASLLIVVTFAQTPNSFKYQAIVRNLSGAPISNQTVGIRTTILKDSMNGTSVCVETFSPTTNNFGLVNLEIGSKSQTSFSLIDWSDGPYFIKIEFDSTGGSNYSFMGTSQLLSVPYALHAKTADSLKGTITEIDPYFKASIASKINANDTSNWNSKLDSESDPIFGASVAGSINKNDTFNWNNKLDMESDPIFGASVAGSINSNDTMKWNKNELQIISISNDTIFLSKGGGFVKLPAAITNTGIFSFEFPEGINGTFVHFSLDTLHFTYTVPSGYNLYITSGSGYYPKVNNVLYGLDGSGPIFPENTVLTYDTIGWGSSIPTGYTGMLIKKTSKITPVHFKLDNATSTYTVPSGKKLVLKSGTGNGSPICINSIPYMNISSVWLFESNVTLSNCNANTMTSRGFGYTGYLIDN